MKHKLLIKKCVFIKTYVGIYISLYRDKLPRFASRLWIIRRFYVHFDFFAKIYPQAH